MTNFRWQTARIGARLHYCLASFGGKLFSMILRRFDRRQASIVLQMRFA
jgi:hypothetical protein